MAINTRIRKRYKVILTFFCVTLLLAFYYLYGSLRYQNANTKKRFDTRTVQMDTSNFRKEQLVATLAKQDYKKKLVNSSRWIQDYQVYQNICIVESYDDLLLSEPLMLYLASYDTTRENAINKFHINFSKGRYDSFWIVNNKNESVPNEWKIEHGIVFLPTYLRDERNVFLLWHNSLPSAYGQVYYAKEQPFYKRERVISANSSSSGYNQTKGQDTLSNTLIATSLDSISKSFQSTFLNLGFDKLVAYKSQVARSPICYEYGIIGERSPGKYIIKARDKIKSIWMKNKPKCTQLHVLLLQRKSTRRILDIDFIKAILEKAGIHNISIIYFEGLSLTAQHDIIRCTTLLMGVQGAGLSWYPFLPKHASVVEFVFVGWPTRYYSRVTKERPDLLPYTMACTPDTPDYILSRYAEKWFNHRGPITQDIKRQLVIKSREYYPIGNTIWKDSDCWCSAEFFTNKLSKITAQVKRLMRGS